MQTVHAGMLNALPALSQPGPQGHATCCRLQHSGAAPPEPALTLRVLAPHHLAAGGDQAQLAHIHLDDRSCRARHPGGAAQKRSVKWRCCSQRTQVSIQASARPGAWSLARQAWPSEHARCTHQHAQPPLLPSSQVRMAWPRPCPRPHAARLRPAARPRELATCPGDHPLAHPW